MKKTLFFYKLWNFIILNGKWGAGGSVGLEWSRKKMGTRPKKLKINWKKEWIHVNFNDYTELL